jgi:hypothetical protein
MTHPIRYIFVVLAIIMILATGCKPMSEEEKRRKEIFRGAESGNSYDQKKLGEAYHYDLEIKDLEKAHYWYNKSAAQGNTDAQYILGRMYIRGEGVSVDFQKAYEWFLKAYAKGDRHAAYYLGWLIGNGKGVQNRDYKMACGFFKYAGDEWMNLDLWTRDDETNWYIEAAERNVAEAQYISGKRAESADFRKALNFYHKAAEQGHPQALKRLGEIYYNGAKGAPKNFNEAIKWWSILGEQGDLETQTKIGEMISEGEGEVTNLEKAQSWFLKAAMQGHAPAQIGLGDLWSKAGSDKVNPLVYSYAWYNLAASYSRDEYGTRTAINGREKVKLKMSASEVNSAQQLSAEWNKEITLNVKEAENNNRSPGR